VVHLVLSCSVYRPAAALGDPSAPAAPRRAAGRTLATGKRIQL